MSVSGPSASPRDIRKEKGGNHPSNHTEPPTRVVVLPTYIKILRTSNGNLLSDGPRRYRCNNRGGAPELAEFNEYWRNLAKVCRCGGCKGLGDRCELPFFLTGLLWDNLHERRRKQHPFFVF